MKVDTRQEKWHYVPSKKRAHGNILTLDDLNKSNWKHSMLISELQAQYKANKKSGIKIPDR